MKNKKIKISTPKVIIKKPRMTEKSTILSDKKIYVFEISKTANKSEVKKEIERIYSTKVKKVNIAKTAPKKVIVKGKKGTKAGIKKAYVYLTKDAKSLEIF